MDRAVTTITSQGRSSLEEGSSSGTNPFEPKMMFIPTPSEKVWSDMVAASNGGFALSGTAATGTIGPLLGRVDIAESTTSYLFRISLPGVKRNPADFTCELKPDGKVVVRGQSTTGETTVKRFSQTFVMQSKNLCASGPFAVYFQLPGPIAVDTFTGTFGSDGILEGIVMKGAAQPSRSYKF